MTGLTDINKGLSYRASNRANPQSSQAHFGEPRIAEGGGCEALGGSSSFTQNYLFKHFINEPPLRLRLRQIHLSLSERLWFANVRLPKGSPYGRAGAVRLRGIFTSTNFSNSSINYNLSRVYGVPPTVFKLLFYQTITVLVAIWLRAM